jgi:hypothetical protein
MATDQRQDIKLDITRIEYGMAGRAQEAVLEIRTGKGYSGGVRSDCSVFWHGNHSRCQMLGLGGPGGDYGKKLKQSELTIKATQKAIDKQHAEVFTPDVIAGLVEAAKAHYAKYVADGVDGFKNTYLKPEAQANVPDNAARAIDEIAADAGRPLSANEIDKLCERINR